MPQRGTVITFNMMQNTNAMTELRLYGGLWLMMAPVAWFMAVISTVKDDDFYRWQLNFFTVASSAAVFLGVAAICRQKWARPGLVALSWIGALIFGGPGLVLVGLGVLALNAAAAVAGFGILIFGVPFVLLALRLQRLRVALAPGPGIAS